jgi:hypothetical protein
VFAAWRFIVIPLKPAPTLNDAIAWAELSKGHLASDQKCGWRAEQTSTGEDWSNEPNPARGAGTTAVVFPVKSSARQKYVSSTAGERKPARTAMGSKSEVRQRSTQNPQNTRSNLTTTLRVQRVLR